MGTINKKFHRIDQFIILMQTIHADTLKRTGTIWRLTLHLH